MFAREGADDFTPHRSGWSIGKLEVGSGEISKVCARFDHSGDQHC